MRMSVKILAALGVLVAVVMVGLMQGWFVGKNSKTSLPSPQTATAPPPPGSHSLRTSAPPTLPVVSAVPITKPVVVTSNSSAAQTSTAAPGVGVITNWEEKLDTILGSEGEESEKAKQLLAIFPRLPQDGQVEVVQHLSNLVSDQDYAALGKMLVDGTLPDDVLEQLMADILNRPNSIKLPYLLDVARNPQHPKAEDAKDLLELYLEDDYGQDWTKWQTHINDWITKNPD
jgi:hypothetical protein